jgi:DNA polymerase-1
VVARYPRVLLTIAEVEAAVSDLLNEPEFVIDVETTKARPRSNSLRWVGLGAAGRAYLIPCGHPKGFLIEPEHREKSLAYLLYPPPDPRGMTPLGKPSNAMKEYTVPARYTDPPKQLYPNEVCEAIRPLLWSPVGKIGHNLKFDLMSLAKYYKDEIPPGPYHDTIILRHVLDESYESYKLKDLVYEWFQIGVHKDKNGDTFVNYKEREAFYPNLGEKGTDNFSLDQVAKYLARDVRYCWLMFQSWKPHLDRYEVRKAYEFEMSLYPAIMGMEYEGFPIDVSVLDKVRAWLVEQQERVSTACGLLAGDQFDLNHPSTKRWILYGRGQRTGKNDDGSPRYEQRPAFGTSKRPLTPLNLKVVSRTKKTHVPQVTQAVLEEYAEDGVEMAALLLEWSNLEKLRGTFIEGLSGYLRYSDNGALPTVHTGFRQHGTVTGRLSAAEPNPQQLPRGDRIRQMYVAGRENEGWTLIVADYDQIELRGAAFLSGDPVMYGVFRQGQDIHRRAASVMFQVPLEKVSGDQRMVGKTQNFGTLYGAGVPKIAAVAGVSMRRAQRFITNYFKEFAYLEPWKAEVISEACARGDWTSPLSRPPYVVIQPTGRRRRLPELFSPDEYKRAHAERQAVNAVVQGLASNITKIAMRDLKDQLVPYPAYMVMQVHDEIVVRVKEEAKDEVLDLTKRVMEGVRHPDTGEPILGEIPLVVSAASGLSWAAAKG